MPSPIRRLVEVVREKKAALKEKLQTLRSKSRGAATVVIPSGAVSSVSTGSASEPKQQKNSRGGTVSSSSSSTTTTPGSSNRTIVSSRVPKWTVVNTRYCHGHPLEQDLKSLRSSTASSSSSSNSSGAGRRSSLFNSPPGSPTSSSSRSIKEDSILLDEESLAGIQLVDAPGSQSPPLSESVLREPPAISSGCSCRGSCSCINDDDSSCGCQCYPTTTERINRVDWRAQQRHGGGPLAGHDESPLVSGWKGLVSERNLIRVLSSPQQQLLSLKVLLHEAMRFTWELHVLHAQWCPQLPPGCDEQIHPSAQPPPPDLDVMYFEFICVWKTLLRDIVEYLEQRTTPSSSCVAVTESGSTESPTQVGREADEPASQHQRQQTGSVVSLKVALAEVVLILHSLELFQRNSALQADIASMQNQWRAYYDAYQSYAQQVQMLMWRCTTTTAPQHIMEQESVTQFTAATMMEEGSGNDLQPARQVLHIRDVEEEEEATPVTQRRGQQLLSPSGTTLSVTATTETSSVGYSQNVFTASEDHFLSTAAVHGGNSGHCFNTPDQLSSQDYAYYSSGCSEPTTSSAQCPPQVVEVPSPPTPPTFLDVPSIKKELASRRGRAGGRRGCAPKRCVTDGDEKLFTASSVILAPPSSGNHQVTVAPSKARRADGSASNQQTVVFMPLNWGRCLNTATKSQVLFCRRKARIHAQSVANANLGFVADE